MARHFAGLMIEKISVQYGIIGGDAMRMQPTVARWVAIVPHGVHNSC